jgi:hypothetical protein
MRHVIAASLFLLASCSQPDESVTLRHGIEQARQKWVLSALKDYSFTVSHACEICLPNISRPHRITVRDGHIVDPMAGEMTIQQYLDALIPLLADSKNEVKAEFDSKLGYPISISSTVRGTKTQALVKITEFSAP